MRRGDWNDYAVIANGNSLLHIFNGHVMSIGIDEDSQKSRKAGRFAWKRQPGPSLKIEMKDVRLRELD